jgi:ABC-type antimicrobial peptide transport system permease subunit
VKAGEVVYPEALREQQGYKLGSKLEGLKAGSGGQTYTIVGFYKTTGIQQQLGERHEVALADREGLAAMFGESHDAEEPVLVYTGDIEGTVVYLTGKGFDAADAYDKDFKQYKSDLRTAYITIVSFAVVLLGVSLLQLYFIIRSSLMTRIYDIGVFRALGASRWDMHKMFVIEIAVLTTATSLIGYLIMTFIIKEIDRMISPFLKLFYFPLSYIVAGVVLVYAINIASGLLPVWRLTGRSPSQILKHHDG